MLRGDARAAWLMVKEFVSQAASDPELAYVAAGPLDGLLVYHGRVVITWVEAEAELGGRFRKALGMVWGKSIDDTVRGRLKAIFGVE